MRRSFLVLGSVIAILAAAGTAVAWAYARATTVTEPSATGVISSCYKASTGAVRLVNAAAKCRSGEHKLSWQQKVPRPKVHQVGAKGEPTYQGNFRAYGEPPFGDLSFYKDAAGIVHLTGLACVGDFTNNNDCYVHEQTSSQGVSTIFTLPAGYRPATEQVLTIMSSDDTSTFQSRVDVTPSGDVDILTPPTLGYDWMSFDGLSFLAK